MKVTVKLLATYQKLMPPECIGGGCVLEIAEGDTFEAVLGKFNIPMDKASVILVNGRTPEPGQKLGDGDVICAFPAIAGG